jgi:hypothetical protein
MSYACLECPDCIAEHRLAPAALRDCEDFGEAVNPDNLCFDHYLIYLNNLPDSEEE